jgi:hypothetical protein
VKLQLNFSSHAKEKMEIREIRESEVCATIDTPDNVYRDVEHETLVAVKKFHGNTIIAVSNIEGDGAKVITLFYTTKFDKLLKTKKARGAWKKTK